MQLLNFNIPVLASRPIYTSVYVSCFYNFHKEGQICISNIVLCDQCLGENYPLPLDHYVSPEYTLTSLTNHDRLEIDSHDLQ